MTQSVYSSNASERPTARATAPYRYPRPVATTTRTAGKQATVMPRPVSIRVVKPKRDTH